MGDTEEVNRYLLGQLSSAERRQFELRLEQSAALRALVRDLETGLVALAASAPQQKAPREAWGNIEAALARQTRWQFWGSLMPLKWLANGWALAGILAVVLCAQNFWPATEPQVSPTKLIATQPAPHWSGTPNFPVVANAFSPPPVYPRTNSPAEIELRQKIMRLENQLAQTAVAGTGTTSSPAVVTAKSLELFPANTRTALGRTRLSPKLQQAALLAVAHQLGWGKNSSAVNAGESASSTSPEVDFVDLPVVASTGNPANLAAVEPTVPGDTTASTDTSGVTMLPWEDNLVAIVDTSTLASDSGPLNIWSVDTDGSPSRVGTVNTGNNPVVITIGGANTQNNPQYFITVGASNTIIGHYPPGP